VIEGSATHRARNPGRTLATAVVSGLLILCAGTAVSAATGPPFPAPVEGQRVYDTIGIFSAASIATAERAAHAIEDRSGAELVVYSQEVDFGITGDEARAQAAALGNQWRVGRTGFDDGVVVLFDIDPSGAHGQVAIVGGDGFRNAYLPDRDAQKIIDSVMIPRLKQSPPQFDLALHDALARIDAAVTPQHVQDLAIARTVNAIAAIVLAPLAFLLLIGAALLRWIRYGKDPVYLDDPSILMPAPPPELTAAAGALIVEGAATRRALTTALLDLASRGRLSFREENSGLLGKTHKLGIVANPPTLDATTQANRARNDRRAIGNAERLALKRLQELSADGYVTPADLLNFSDSVGAFNSALEDDVVARGWYPEAPSETVMRSRLRAAAECVVGGLLAGIGYLLPASGLLVFGLAVVAAGVATFVLAGWMPSVTMPGAVIRAMLAAYRRTLEKTMAQARSMQQVVDEAKLTWLETPDQAVVWGTALGLGATIEQVLKRSLEDVRSGAAQPHAVWFPVWYGTSDGASGGGGAVASGSMFSASALPDFNGMFNVLGTVGNSPASSGSGGGGGFSGGGGFGGGASGGF
jgi:uncharacterized membrane protein YgcG